MSVIWSDVRKCCRGCSYRKRVSSVLFGKTVPVSHSLNQGFVQTSLPNQQGLSRSRTRCRVRSGSKPRGGRLVLTRLVSPPPHEDSRLKSCVFFFFGANLSWPPSSAQPGVEVSPAEPACI